MVATCVIIVVVGALLFATSHFAMIRLHEAEEMDRALSRTELVVISIGMWFAKYWLWLPIPAFLGIYFLSELFHRPRKKAD